MRCEFLAPPPPSFGRSPSPVVTGEDPLGRDLSVILPCEAGEGDHAQHGGGGAHAL